MRFRSLDLLVCSRCGGELDIRSEKTTTVGLPEDFEPRQCSYRCAYHKQGGKLKDCRPCYKLVVEEGRLDCRSCSESFDIRGGVPRLQVVDGPEPAVIRKTRERYAYARKWFDRSEVQDGWVKDSYSYYQEFPEILAGGNTKIALDVGCGSGADLLRFAEEGFEVVGVDLTDSIDEAYANTRHLPSISTIQADLHHLPFRQGAFDVVCAFGVIHHLPNPHRGFQCLDKTVKPGGWVLVYVYEDFSERSAFERRALRGVNLLRAATTRLPPALLHGLCMAGTPLVLLGCTLPHQIL